MQALTLQIPDDVQVSWKPNPGSQTAYLAWHQPGRTEVLYEGPRGCGKSEVGLAKFAMHVGKGYGNHWRGIIFRREFDELEDIKVKGERFFQKLENKPIFLRSATEYKFVWQTGEELLLRHIKDPTQYWRWHGQEYPFIHWEELTTWPTLDLYDMLKSVSRSPIKEIPRIYSSSTNPYGPGHSAVKRRFIDPIKAHRGPNGASFLRLIATNEDGSKEYERLGVFTGALDENPYIAINDPEYIKNLKAIADKNKRLAWVQGSWDIAVGDFFEGYWYEDRHVIDHDVLPKPGWEAWRALDWGTGVPYAVGWFTLAPPGEYGKNAKIIMYRELYGWGGSENKGTDETGAQVAQKIHDLESIERSSGVTFANSPADHDIFGEKGHEHSINEAFISQSVYFNPAKKGPKSRVNGAVIFKQALEDDAFAVTRNCTHFLRTVPTIPRDPDKPDDVDTDAEDHMYDMARYSLMSRHSLREKKPEEDKVVPGSWRDITTSKPKKLPRWAR